MIEKELFSNYSIDEKKLREYGFQPEGSKLIYTQELPAENFQIIITYDRALGGKIIDLSFGEEYVNYRMESAKGFSAEITMRNVPAFIRLTSVTRSFNWNRMTKPG